MQILNLGQLGLDEWMGSDRKIARMAWVSYGNQDSERTDEEVNGVLRYMMKHRHGSPFEHVVFTFYVKAPIFVAREWFRHRVGSFNEISGRYKTLEPEFYIPSEIRIKGGSNKQGSIYADDVWAQSKDWVDLADFDATMKKDLTNTYEIAYDTYVAMIEAGVANEIARLVLPVGLYTQWFWTVNLRSLFNFMNLRSDEKAQWEIRQYSIGVEDIVKDLVPMSYAAWEDNGRVAP